ncbi:HCP-like protein, partial [Paraphysoderma sedebokerense]
ETIEHHRQSAKRSPDPSVQLEFARYLVEVADAAAQTEISPKTAKKKREALLHEGLKLVKKLASTGTGVGKSQPYPEAMVFLAECYGNGTLGLNIDHDKAFHLYLQASKLNHPSATYRVGVCYDVGAGTKRDSARAREFYRKAAALGDPPAMYKFGLILLNGLLGCPQNPREAITWLKRAAAVSDESNPHALHELGLIYEKPGVPSVIPDEAYARELFTQAAQLGYAPSQYKMGLCYEHGTLTCANDPARSLAWYSRAAEQGHPEAELALSGWYLTGCEGILRQSDEQAYAWARKAADKGLSKAEYAVGYYSEMGIGVPQSLDEARRWYQRAAAQGNRKAMQRLQELKKYGKALRNEKPIRNGNDSDCVIM